ncbi:MAG TPA: DUF2878 domain-containing protein [Phycisphaerae bacterium]|nr:DUF2878 domain-containing protein [Phycisphaerae bacterium]HRW54243.1 DUF2878 domain-containing protein [Phycisphaerae bacterium]
MSRQRRVIVNVIALQVGWFACVLGAAWGLPWTGPALVLLAIAIHLAASPHRSVDATLIAMSAIIGLIVDSLLMQSGVIAFNSGVTAGWITPAWMIALWANFGTSLNLTLAILQNRWFLAILFGAAGGALAYIGGVRLGALLMPAGIARGGMFVAFAWAVVTPLLVGAAAQARRRSSPCSTKRVDAEATA